MFKNVKKLTLPLAAAGMVIGLSGSALGAFGDNLATVQDEFDNTVNIKHDGKTWFMATDVIDFWQNQEPPTGGFTVASMADVANMYKNYIGPYSGSPMFGDGTANYVKFANAFGLFADQYARTSTLGTPEIVPNPHYDSTMDIDPITNPLTILADTNLGVGYDEGEGQFFGDPDLISGTDKLSLTEIGVFGVMYYCAGTVIDDGVTARTCDVDDGGDGGDGGGPGQAPEPSILGLLGAGAMMMGYAAYRRKRD